MTHSLRARSSILKLALYSSLFCLSVHTSRAATYNLRTFDQQCGQAGYNCRSAFQKAFDKLANDGGGTLLLPAGTFPIDFPELAGASKYTPITKASLLTVPPNTLIKGHTNSSGEPDSIITWQIAGFPVMLFIRASGSSLDSLHIRYTGISPTKNPDFVFRDITILKALGYNPAYQHEIQATLSYELFTFALVMDSEHCTFNKLTFDSATHDNGHIFGYAIILKGKDLNMSGDGGGLHGLASSNKITNIKLFDYTDAIAVSGQDNLLIQNISSNRRGSSTAIPPGHVIYVTGQPQYAMTGAVTLIQSSTNLTIDSVTDGDETYNNDVALGTLAVKDLVGGRISNVTSKHPVGLIQTMIGLKNVTFSNMSWTSNYDLCANAPKNCSTPVINFIPSRPNETQSSNITFNNISLKSTKTPIIAILGGDNLAVNGLDIQTPPDFKAGQTNTNAVVSLRYTNKAVINNYVYSPLISVYDPHAKYNTPLTAWNTASNVSARVTVKWPEALDRPSETETVVRADSQDKTANNDIKAVIKHRSSPD